MTRSRTTTAAIGLAIALALSAAAAGCGRTTEQSTNGGPPTTGSGVRPPATTAPADTAPTTLPPGCHRVPASTAPGLPGGGEIVCEVPPASGVSPGTSPAAPPTTVPDTTTSSTAALPAGQGTIRGTLGGSPCSRSRPQDPCPSIYELLTGRVTVDPLDPGGTRTAVVLVPQADPTRAGQFEVPVAAGRYRLAAQPDRADRICDPVEVTVTAGQVTDTSFTCTAP